MANGRKKKLIEVAIPLEAINKASAREKSIRHSHPSTLHLWWARRPLAACRAVLFAQMVNDPSSFPERFRTKAAVEAERERLFGIMRELVVWENSFDGSVLKRAREEVRRSCGGNLPRVHDPFGGGCSVSLEAQRLGLPASGSDLNPVAVLIGKATAEFPALFAGQEPAHPGVRGRNNYRNAEGLAEDVRFYGNLVLERASRSIGHLYPKAWPPPDSCGGAAVIVAWLWLRTVPSPDPAFGGSQVPLASSFRLNSRRGREVWLEPEIDRAAKKIRFLIRHGGTPDEINNARQGSKAGRGANFRCLLSGAAITPDHVRAAGRGKTMGQQLMAIVANSPRGKVYLPADGRHEEAAFAARADWRPDLRFNNDALGFRVGAYGFEIWGDLFTERQLAALNAFSRAIDGLKEEIERAAAAAGFPSGGLPLEEGGTGARAYADAVATYLALALSKCADYWSSICTWDASWEKIRTTFARHAVPMVWDFAEANPFSGKAGSWSAVLEGAVKAISCLNARNNASVTQQDARTVRYEPNAAICTDPPYYDNIGYADLSDFFHCWLRPLLKDVHPGLFRGLAAPKSDELVATPFRHGGKAGAEKYFLDGMSETLANMARGTSGEYPTTIFYAFKQKEIEKEGISSTGWATFLEAVIDAGFSVVRTWPVRTEMSSRLRAIGSSALASSVVLVCRRRDDSAKKVGRSEFVAALKKDMPPAIDNMTKAGIAPADLPQSAIGPGIGIYSQFAAVLESDDSRMAVKTALQLINRELDEHLSGIAGEFDADTRFALTWFEQHGFGEGEFGAAESIAMARGISVEGAKSAGIISIRAGKVRLLRRAELDAEWDPETDRRIAVWECLHHLIRVLEAEGEQAAGELLRRINGAKQQETRDLAYCFYEICSGKRSDAGEALACNSLLAAWPAIASASATFREAVVQHEMEV